MSNSTPRWLKSGYGDVEAARLVDGVLEVQFANGDVVRTALSAVTSEDVTHGPVEVVDGLSILIGDGDRLTEISWIAIRSATDQEYAKHLIEQDGRERIRLGRRLKALREDGGAAKTQVARDASISLSKLSDIERGIEESSPADVRSILRALGANLSDISGDNALEVSVKTMIKHVAAAGVPRELAATFATSVRRNCVPQFLAMAFGWSEDAVVAGSLESLAFPIPVQFKAAGGGRPTGSPLVQLALSVARIARNAFSAPPYRSVPSDPAIVRDEVLRLGGRMSLASLLDWAWSRGIPILPLEGKGGFSAAVFEFDHMPVILIKDSRDLAVFWLFDLAHELGHLGRGHVRHALIDVDPPTSQEASDDEELEATQFALELLLPDYHSLLAEVRRDARGSGVRFKFSVEKVARRFGVSAGLLGIVAAFAMPDTGRPQDRWGSATNLARPEGSGRSQVLIAAQKRAVLDQLPELQQALIRAAVLGPLEKSYG